MKQCQDFYKTIEQNAAELGLSVNAKKTQLVCVSSAINSDPTSYIELPDKMKIFSQDSIKVLGFTLGSQPNVNAQVESLKKKFRARAWIVRHLKRAGLVENDLVLMYKTLVRPVLDYMAAVYHPMLSKQQRTELERLQMGCMKIIFGYDLSYRETL